jgi:glycosyltransferase involved in cell wall biosynthesis
MKRKILFFISSLDGGGAERVMADILNQVDKSAVDPVLVLLYPFENSPYQESLPPGLRIIVVKRKSDSSFEKIRQFINFLRTVCREDPKGIVSMLTHNNIIAIVAGILLRKKRIVCEHNTLGEVIKTKEGRKILWFPVSPLVKVLYRFADRIIAVSDGIKANLTEQFGVPARGIEVICNPLDIDRIGALSRMPCEHPFFRRGVPVIVAVGRLVWQKGFDLLLKAYRQVLSEQDALLILVGEGQERESLQGLAAELGIAGKVSFAGFQTNPYSFVSNADIFVLSSRYEGLPMAILEALACGTPVISADCASGPREILDNGRCGRLVPAGDIGALAAAIAKLLGDKPLREEFSRRGKERAGDFAIGRIVKRYEQAIDEAIGK